MQLALKARSKPIRTVSFVPPMISTGNPDIDLIHSSVQKAIDRSEGKSVEEEVHVVGDEVQRSPPAPRGGSIGNLKQGYAANQSSDLSSVC